MTLSPKARFQKTKIARSHADLVRQEQFIAAIDFALLEYVYQQASNKEEYLDACAANRITGARQFIDVLLNLSEPRSPRKTDNTTNLQHTV